MAADAKANANAALTAPFLSGQRKDCPNTATTFLNDGGVSMQSGSDGITLYCGRTLAHHPLRSHEGQCGPLDGPQCDDCWRAQVIGREQRRSVFPGRSLISSVDADEDIENITDSKKLANQLRHTLPLPEKPTIPCLYNPCDDITTDPGVVAPLAQVVNPASPRTPKTTKRQTPSTHMALNSTVLFPTSPASYAAPGGDYTPLPPPPAKSGSQSHKPFFGIATEAASTKRDTTQTTSPPLETLTHDTDKRSQKTLQQGQGHVPSLTQIPRSLPSALEASLELCKDTTGAAKVLGTGAYAVVCLARDRASGTARALKVVATRPLEIRNILEQARLELSLQQSLRHPHIARILNGMETDGNIYMTLEFAGFGNLKQLTSSQTLGRLPVDQAWVYLRQVADAVAYLHSDAVRVLHRDIKATNILLSSQDDTKLTDFGWSVRFDDMELPAGLAGTTSHMAPEVLQGFPHGTGADCWSCGVLLYEVAVGTLPFADHRSSCRAQFQLPAFLSEGVREVLRKLLRVDPSRRLRATELLEVKVLNVEVPTHINRLMSQPITAQASVDIPSPKLVAVRSTRSLSPQIGIRSRASRTPAVAVKPTPQASMGSQRPVNAQYLRSPKPVLNLRGLVTPSSSFRVPLVSGQVAVVPTIVSPRVPSCSSKTTPLRSVAIARTAHVLPSPHMQPRSSFGSHSIHSWSPVPQQVLLMSPVQQTRQTLQPQMLVQTTHFLPCQRSPVVSHSPQVPQRLFSMPASSTSFVGAGHSPPLAATVITTRGLDQLSRSRCAASSMRIAGA